MKERHIPILLLEGTPFERGRQHGAAFPTHIVSALTRLRHTWGDDEHRKARARATASWPLVDAYAPDAAAEIRGIAHGASCDATDLLLHIGFEFFPAESPSGCSGLAVSTPRGAVIGQNWDAPPDAAASLVLFIHADENGLEKVMIGSIGMLGWVGANRSGMCLLNNDLLLDTAEVGLPSQIVRRVALDQPDTASALSALSALPHMGGRAYLLGDRAGRIAAVEVSPSVGVRTLSQQATLFHTNHALSPDIIAVEDGARLAGVYPSSRQRLEVLRRTGADATSAAEVMRTLRNRESAPDAISKTPSRDEPTETAFSVIFDQSRREMHLCAGPPSSGGYAAIPLDDRLGDLTAWDGRRLRAQPSPEMQTETAPSDEREGGVPL